MNRFYNTLKALGLASVVAVNLFVFGSDFFGKYLPEIPAFEKAFLHFSDEHGVNQSPFNLSLSFASAPSHEWSEAPILPATPLQLFVGLLAALIISSTSYSRRVSLLRSDKMNSTLFVSSIVVPPPELS